MRCEGMNDATPSSKATWMRSILDRHEGPLTRYAARITGDVDLARDVVQEVFMRLCAEDPSEVNGRMPQWLFTVCRNQALDVRRKERRMRTLELAEVAVPADGRLDPSIAAEGRETHSRVLRLLATLPESQQEIVRLRFQNGLSYKNIAEVTGLTVTNVGYLIHTAIKTMRERLGETNELL